MHGRFFLKERKSTSKTETDSLEQAAERETLPKAAERKTDRRGGKVIFSSWSPNRKTGKISKEFLFSASYLVSFLAS